MKKAVALLLLLGVCFTSSCIDRSGTDDDVSTDETTIEETTAAEIEYLETKVAKSIIFTNNMPELNEGVDPAVLKNIFDGKVPLNFPYDDFVRVTNISYALVINDKDILKHYFELISELNYEDYYDPAFFDNNFVLMLLTTGEEFTIFDSFEYAFSTENNCLTLICQKVEPDFLFFIHEIIATNVCFVSIAKADIPIEDKDISNENINIEFYRRQVQ